MDRFDNQEVIYRIKIRGRLREKWAEWLDGVVLSIENFNPDTGDTIITVRIPDQAALRGIMNKIWDLNLTLISVITCDE